MVFRVSAKNFSLTFPRCNATLERLQEFLLSMKPNYLVVSQEEHEDGYPHLHAAIGFESKKNIKNMAHFDFDNFHCNIQSTKNVKDWIKYIKKDGKFLEFGNVENKKPKLSEIPEGELFDHCVANRVGYGYYQEEKRRRNNVSLDILEEGVGTMNFYLSSLIPDFSKTIVLIGTSGVGKTTWAIKHAAKPAILISHADDLKLYQANYHRSIIFDDMSFTQWPTTSQIHLVDKDLPRSIHIRYGTVKLPAGTTKIFTCNTMPFIEEEAILRRINLIKVYIIIASSAHGSASLVAILFIICSDLDDLP